MTNLEKLESDIRQKLPRLKELTEGCMIIFMDKSYTIDHIDEFNCFASLTYKDRTVIQSEKIKQNSLIIGKNVKLNDVIEWLILIRYWSDLEINDKGLWVDEQIKWNLSKPYLKDQSQELIDYLAGLI